MGFAPGDKGRRVCVAFSPRSQRRTHHPAIVLVGEVRDSQVEGAELLFRVLTERDERASIAVASNAPFSEWGQTFTDSRLAGAVLDRLTFPGSHPRDWGIVVPAPDQPLRQQGVTAC